MKKIFASIFFLILFACCSKSTDAEVVFVKTKSNMFSSGEMIYFNIDDNKSKEIEIKLVGDDNVTYETYKSKVVDNSFIINRFLNKKIPYGQNYSLTFETEFSSNQIINDIDISIDPSIIIKSLCSTEDCNLLSNNVLEKIKNKLTINFYNIAPVKITYNITSPNDSFQVMHEYNTPVLEDWLENLVFNEVKDEYSSYIIKIEIVAYDSNGNEARTEIPIRVVRPIEVKHFGKYEIAEVYEPIPVTGCIPGTLGSNVQYSESQSETRQNNVSITLDKSWSDSKSRNLDTTTTEGISIGETSSTINSSSLTDSETQTEGFVESQTQGESSNIQFNSSDGENWSWSLDESEQETNGTSQNSSTNTSINGSTTVGVSGEGSLPFIAKASGKVEVTAGVQRGWGNSNTDSNSTSRGSSRAYTTGGSSQNGRSYGGAQNDSRSYSLDGSYVLSSSTSNTVSESSSLSSARVWNMSESISSGNVITEGNRESLAQTITTSESSSTTFSYSGYIPRGRFGTFFRQTSRYVKLSEIITYTLNGIPQHAGFIMMNTWAWAPELSVSETCTDTLISNLPKAECIISPCGE